MLSFIPRKWCRGLLTLTVCLTAAILLHLVIFPEKTFKFGKKSTMADGFIAIGRAFEYPDKWEKGTRDPFYDLLMAGDVDSPGESYELQTP